MFTISVETRFQASHRLLLPDGSFEQSHNHDWLVIAILSSNRLNNIGMVMDFHKVKAMLNLIVSEFEGKALEKTSHFQQNNPSAENVAKYIYDKVKTQIPDGVKLRAVKVLEEPGCTAEYSE